MKFGFSILLRTVSEYEVCIKYKLHFQTKFTLNFADHLKNGILHENGARYKIQGESLARGLKLLSIKNYVIEIMT